MEEVARLWTQCGEAVGVGAKETQRKPSWEPGGVEWGEGADRGTPIPEESKGRAPRTQELLLCAPIAASGI